MSLSSILIGSSSIPVNSVDEGLDAVFRSSAGASLSSRPTASKNTSTSGTAPLQPSSSRKRKGLEDDKDQKKKKKKGKNAVSSAVEEVAPNSLPLDDSYTSAHSSKTLQLDETENVNTHSGIDEDTSDVPVHEALAKRPPNDSKERSGKLKFVPADETREQRDARTIFIGNLPVEIVKSRSMLKQLKRHIQNNVPTAKIECTRFRSVAFKKPTAKLETDDADKPSTKLQRQQNRAATWRNQHSEGKDTEDGKEDEKSYLTPQEKRKLAFIKGELHEQAVSVHAYVVFAHPIPDDLRPKNVPKHETMDPYAAARLAVQTCDGTSFAECTIRVDLVRHGEMAAGEGKTDKSVAGAGTGDPKLCVFVGNLDFASKEEDLRVFFEGLVSAERGAPAAGDDQDDETAQAKTWVTRVRMVKDRDTQLGKGFAYVQFADRECVDEVLALEQERLKFAKRKLRVQRCKTAKPSSAADSRKEHASVSSAGRRNASSRLAAQLPPIPKGDPTLGEQLAGLSKESRKQVKSTDPDRLARRLAKKKARIALDKAGLKAKGKDRSRDRPRKTGGPAGFKNLGKKESKGRVRSDKSIARRNMKKQ